jgi:hypothetical protein
MSPRIFGLAICGILKNSMPTFDCLTKMYKKPGGKKSLVP